MRGRDIAGRFVDLIRIFHSKVDTSEADEYVHNHITCDIHVVTDFVCNRHTCDVVTDCNCYLQTYDGYGLCLLPSDM